MKSQTATDDQHAATPRASATNASGGTRWLTRLAALAVALAPLAAPLSASADTASYPDKPIRFIVPYPPGGGTDVIARIVQARFQQLL
ncbi:MAG: hypothetical protein JWP52_119, partial [Rhizobacter sp.]|nr:hypothetical protein [Rhizobacter sp.]